MLINCVAYQEGARLVDLPVEQISDYLDEPGLLRLGRLARPRRRRNSTRCGSSSTCTRWPSRTSATDTSGRRWRSTARPLFVVMQLVEFAGGELHVGEVAVFAGPNYVLSVRTGSKQHFLGVRERCEREPHLLKQGSGYVLYALMDAVVDRYFPILEVLQTELESIEERIFIRGATRVNIQRLYELKRKVVTSSSTRCRRLLQFAGKLLRWSRAGGVREHAGLLSRRERPSGAHRRGDRFDPRHHRHGHHGQPVDGHDRGERGHQAPGSLGGDLRGGNRLRRHLGHELRAHARAQAPVGLPGRADV